MNKAIKLLPLLAAIVILPNVAMNVQAQDTTIKPEQARKHHKGNHFNQLNLTPEQKASMKQMRQETRAEMDKILTADQKAKLQAMKGDKKGMHQGWKELNLTPKQKAQMKALRQAQKAKFKAMLTREQQAQMEKTKEGRGERFGN